MAISKSFIKSMQESENILCLSIINKKIWRTPKGQGDFGGTAHCVFKDLNLHWCRRRNCVFYWTFISTKMWNLMSMRPDPKFAMQKGCFHMSVPFLGAVTSDKQFPVFKPETKQSIHHNYTSIPKSDLPENSSQMKNENHMCNKKKKKKRRRRKKKNKNQKKEITVQRQRQLSVESEDSFVIFFEDEQLSEVTETTEDFDSCDSLVPIKKVQSGT